MISLRACAATTGRAARLVAFALIALAIAAATCTDTARAAEPGAAGGSCDAPAASQYLAANASEAGVIRLIFFDAEGSPVEFSECVGATLRRVGIAHSAPNTMTSLTT